MDYIIRPSKAEDNRQLRDLWGEVFGDGDSFLDPFFEIFSAPDVALVCDEKGKIISAVYPLPVGELVDGDKITPCVMIYALGTLEEERGNRCASALMKSLNDENTLYVLRPAEESLFDYYEMLGYRSVFSFRDDVRTYDMMPTQSNGHATRLTAAQYGEMREKMLQNTAHIRYSEAALAFEDYLSGGRMYELTSDGFKGLCVIEKYLTTAYVKELLVDNAHYEDALAIIAQIIEADKYRIRTVSPDGDRFGMAKGKNVPDYGAWYGFAFD